MKLKLFSQITIAFLLSVCTAHTVYAISSLGNNPFYKPPLSSVSDMKNMFIEKQDDVKAGLVKAGYGDLFEPLIAQLQDADVATVEYHKGQELQWMFYRRGGKGAVRVDQGVLWESDTPFTSFEFDVDHKGQRYTFTVPLACGNLALLAVGPVPVTVAPVPAPVPVPPPVSTQSSAAGSPGSGAGPQAAPAQASTFPILFDVGYLHQLDPAHFLLLRIGTEYKFNDSISLTGMIGGAPLFRGAEGEHAFVADVLANYNWSRSYLGAGFGAWLTSGDSDISHEDSDFDIILHFGTRIFGEPDGFNTSLFFEIRSAVDELDEFDLYGRFGGGLRFRF